MGQFLGAFSQEPQSPTSVTQRGGRKEAPATMADLLETLRLREEQQNEANTNATQALAEDLHRRVLESEEGFRQQSQIFRESLTNTSKSIQASEFRNGGAFRRRHEQAVRKLEHALAEFEATYLTTSSSSAPKNPCAKCGCELTAYEMANFPQSRKRQQQQQQQQYNGTASGVICSVCLGEEIFDESKLAARRQQQQSAPSRNFYASRYSSSSSFRGPYPASNRKTAFVRRPPVASSSSSSSPPLDKTQNHARQSPSSYSSEWTAKDSSASSSQRSRPNGTTNQQPSRPNGITNNQQQQPQEQRQNQQQQQQQQQRLGLTMDDLAAVDRRMIPTRPSEMPSSTPPDAAAAAAPNSDSPDQK